MENGDLQYTKYVKGITMKKEGACDHPPRD